MTIFLLIFSAFLNGVAQLLWKYGLSHEPTSASSLTEKLLGLITNLSFVSGFFLYGLSIIVWIIVISKIEVSYAYPLLSLSYIVVMIGGYFLGETMSLARLFGVACILVGIFFIARS